MTKNGKKVRKTFKILVVGDIGCGKTSVIKRYVHDKFSANYKPTIGIDHALKKVKQNDQRYDIQLWDLGGHERFGNMTRIYYGGADAAVIVFDITRPSTLEAVEKWYLDIISKTPTIDGSQHIPIILIANKCDLVLQPSTQLMIDKCCIGYELKCFKVSCKWDKLSDVQNPGDGCVSINAPFKHLLNILESQSKALTMTQFDVTNHGPFVHGTRTGGSDVDICELWDRYTILNDILEKADEKFGEDSNYTGDYAQLLQWIISMAKTDCKEPKRLRKLHEDIQYNIATCERAIKLICDIEQKIDQKENAS